MNDKGLNSKKQKKKPINEAAERLADILIMQKEIAKKVARGKLLIQNLSRTQRRFVK